MSHDELKQEGANEQVQGAQNVEQARRQALEDHKQELAARIQQLDTIESARQVFDVYINEREESLSKKEQDISYRERQLEENKAELNSPKSASNPQSVLDILDAKIAAANDTKTIQELVRQRAELLKQQQEEIEARHKRVLDYWKTAEKFVLTPSLITAGIWLLFSQFVWIGGMMIGAGLFIVVPDFVKLYLDKIKNDAPSVGGGAQKGDNEAR